MWTTVRRSAFSIFTAGIAHYVTVGIAHYVTVGIAHYVRLADYVGV
jgi:hypothetical protein